MTVEEGIRQTKSKMLISSRAIKKAQAMLQPGEPVLFACGGSRLPAGTQVLTWLGNKLPQQCNGVFVLTDRRVFFCGDMMLGLQKSSAELALTDIHSVETETPAALNPIIRIKGYATEICGFIIGPHKNAADFEQLCRQAVARAQAPQQPAAANAPVPDIDAARLLQWKQLLDAGAITQEEYDAKKKQLLGL